MKKNGHKAISHRIVLRNDDVIMTFIGQRDKNNNDLWTGDIVKFDPRGHGNYVLGVIVYDTRITSFIVDQLTHTRDFYQTQEELDEEFYEELKKSPEAKLLKTSIYQFDSPTNWYDILFYDDIGACFSYSELEVVGTLYKNSKLVIENHNF